MNILSHLLNELLQLKEFYGRKSRTDPLNYHRKFDCKLGNIMQAGAGSGHRY